MKRLLAIMIAVTFSAEVASYMTYGAKGTADKLEWFAGIQRVACK